VSLNKTIPLEPGIYRFVLSLKSRPTFFIFGISKKEEFSLLSNDQDRWAFIPNIGVKSHAGSIQKYAKIELSNGDRVALILNWHEGTLSFVVGD